MACEKAARDGSAFTAFTDVSVPPFSGETHTQPVYVLTTNSTGGAAEVFTLNLAQRPQATVAGHRSSGVLSDVLDRALPNGWTFSLANEVYRSPAGEEFEAIGVPVDLQLDLPAFPLEDRLNHHDNWLEEIQGSSRPHADRGSDAHLEAAAIRPPPDDTHSNGLTVEEWQRALSLSSGWSHW